MFKRLSQARISLRLPALIVGTLIMTVIVASETYYLQLCQAAISTLPSTHRLSALGTRTKTKTTRPASRHLERPQPLRSQAGVAWFAPHAHVRRSDESATGAPKIPQGPWQRSAFVRFADTQARISSSLSQCLPNLISSTPHQRLWPVASIFQPRAALGR